MATSHDYDHDDHSNEKREKLTPNVALQKRYVNLYSGVSDRSHFKTAVQRQPQVRTMLANRKVRRMAVSIPNTAPVVHFTPSRSRYQFILLGEQRHTCVNNLPRVAEQPGIELATSRSRIRRPTATPLSHTVKLI